MAARHRFQAFGRTFPGHRGLRSPAPAVQKVIRWQRTPSAPQFLAYLPRDEKGRELATARIVESQRINEILVPRRLNLEWPAQQLKISVKLEDVSVNVPTEQEWAKQLFQRPTFVQP